MPYSFEEKNNNNLIRFLILFIVGLFILSIFRGAYLEAKIRKKYMLECHTTNPSLSITECRVLVGNKMYWESLK